MDYKETHAKAPTWEADLFYPQSQMNAYGVGDASGLFEVHAPDLSICFLAIHGFFDEPANLFYCYGIDSPRVCAERQAFEWGKISWMDFWFHKPWLLRIAVPFEPATVVSDYIRPSDMPQIMIDAFEIYGFQGPYIMKHDQLMIACEHAPLFGRDPIEAERRYREFMAFHGHRFTQNAG